MWVDLDGNTSRREPGSGTEASNTDDEATNEGGEFHRGCGGPHKDDVSPTATL